MNKSYLAKKIYSKKTIKEINKKIKLLGISTNYDTYTFLNIRLFGTILIFIIFLFISKLGFMIAPALAFIYYKAVTYIMLDYKIKQRSNICIVDSWRSLNSPSN